MTVSPTAKPAVVVAAGAAVLGQVLSLGRRPPGRDDGRGAEVRVLHALQMVPPEPRVSTPPHRNTRGHDC